MNKTLRLSLGLTAAAASTSTALLSAPAQAQTQSGPGLDATRNLTINAATTFNNSYGTSFEANGDLTGSANFTDPNTGVNLNSGTAFVSAMVSFDGGSAGVLAGVSGLSQSINATGDQFITRGGSTITIANAVTSPLAAVEPANLVINGAGSSSTVGGSFIGTNIGTEVLQVGGSMSETIINQLSAF